MWTWSIHSGDVFDSVRPATHVIIGFLKQTFRITRQDIPYLVAAGNHETPRLRSTTAALEYANLVNAISAHGFDIDYEPIEVDGDDRGGNARPARRRVRDGGRDPGAGRGREHTRHARVGARPRGAPARDGRGEPAAGDAGGRLRLHRPRPLPRLPRAQTERLLCWGYGAFRVRGGRFETWLRHRRVRWDWPEERRARRDRGSSDAGPEEDLRPERWTLRS